MRRILSLLALSAFVFFSCGKAPDPKSVCVFVPGMTVGSPIYEQLVSGAKRAVAEVPGATLDVIEGGYDQATWKDKLAEIGASGKYGLVITSNPSMPELCSLVAPTSPSVKFFVADGYKAGEPYLHTVLYNQLEQGYLLGYLAGLVTKSGIPGANPDLKAAIVVAQSYSTFDQYIKPGFEKGLEADAPGAVCELRIVGSWQDAKRASELTDALLDAGVDIVLPIVGGASQGVLASAKGRGAYAVYIDGGDGYAKAPGVVVGCAILDQDKLVYERTLAILKGDASFFGKADIVDAKGGYIGFDFSGDAYQALPEGVKSAFQDACAAVAAGIPELAIAK